MICANCERPIRPGLVITIDAFKTERSHCPYCLAILPTQSSSLGAAAQAFLAGRQDRRRSIRERFVDRLIEASSEGALHCPLCDRALNQSDENLLRNDECFRCHLCCSDLAAVAYQQEAYHAQRWLPVEAALADLMEEKKCENCRYLAAMTKACLTAASHTPKATSRPAMLALILRRTAWDTPVCDWESCFAVRQYGKTAGDGLQLL